MVRHYWIDGKWYAAGPVARQFTHGELADPTSCAYFCPVCGEVWARTLVEGAPWVVVTRDCRKHPANQLTPAGSIWAPLDTHFNDSLPHDVLQREVAVHFEHYDWLRRQNVTPI